MSGTRSPNTVRLKADESAYLDSVLGVARFYAHDPVRLMQAAGEGARSRRVGWEIDEMSTPRWRDHTEARGVLTGDRLLLDDGGWRIRGSSDRSEWRRGECREGALHGISPPLIGGIALGVLGTGGLSSLAGCGPAD
jgi:hypothetical protein